MPHLLVALSAHGFGHAAQAAAVVNALRRRLPDLRLTLRTQLPQEFLTRRFVGVFEVTSCETDVGMVMNTALDIDISASAEAYTRFHADWDDRVRNETRALAHLAPDLVLADIPYLILAAAAQASIPAVAICSLNWADIYAHYFDVPGSTNVAGGKMSGATPGRPEARVIHGQIQEAYRQAVYFLQTEPSMPMPNLPRRVAIGPVARIGVDQRAALKQRLGLSPSVRLAMIALGGIDMHLPLARWPRQAGVHWLIPAAWGIARPDASAIETLDMPFTDLLRSVEALVGKPGYGTFTEAACNGTPVLYVRRADWPEEPYLVKWLRQRGNCRQIERQRLEQGDLASSLQQLWEQPRRPLVAPSGIEQAVKFFVEHWFSNARIA